jgi:hypothetical protein
MLNVVMLSVKVLNRYDECHGVNFINIFLRGLLNANDKKAALKKAI